MTAIQNLEPRKLGQLIDRVGLEDSSEIISLATTDQLQKIFDDDLWVSEGPGRDETFDADRFALWLEVMLEAGEDFAAQKLTELPEDIVTLGLHRHILVLNMEHLQTLMEDHEAGKRIDKALEGYLYEELDDYQVISRRHDGWDAIVSILTALDKEDHAFLNRVLARCCFLSAEYIDDNGGLYEVLTSEEMIASDLAADREDRRAAEGFVAPSQAASFLALARSAAPKEVIAGPRDAVTRAYFRELNVSPEKPVRSRDAMPALPAPGAPIDRTRDLESLLAELEVSDREHVARPVPLLEGEGGTQAKANSISMFKTALADLQLRDVQLHARRLEELAYLTNIVVAGCVVDGGPFRPFEAVIAVAAICDVGLAHLVGDARNEGTLPARASRCLMRDGAEKVFRVGFWLLHHDAAFAARAAIERSAGAERVRAFFATFEPKKGPNVSAVAPGRSRNS